MGTMSGLTLAMFNLKVLVGVRLVSENGLTWELVDEVLGASSSLRGCNLSRRANSKRARKGHPWLVEEDSSSANEEEEEDPHDDAFVSDCDDAPNGPNGDAENMEATNIPDEFDDGY